MNTFLEATLQTLQTNKRLAERAVAQVSDEKLKVSLDPNTNSIAVIMKHVGGNLRSRWTDFLTSDGEKPWRDRDSEFVDTFANRTELFEFWEQGWRCFFDAIAALDEQDLDLDKVIEIRGEPHTVWLAIQRSLGHTCYHVGQIIQVARIQAGDDWETLTIPRGQSEQFNQESWGGNKQ